MIRLVVTKENYAEDGISEIYFSFGGQFFPEEGWTDFDRVLTIWLTELDMDGSDGLLPFMDGPFQFSVQKMDEDAYLFEFWTSEDGSYARSGRYISSSTEYKDLIRHIGEYLRQL